MTSQYAPETRGRRGVSGLVWHERAVSWAMNDDRVSAWQNVSDTGNPAVLIVVDDEQDVRATVVNFLVDAGYCVIQA